MKRLLMVIAAVFLATPISVTYAQSSDIANDRLAELEIKYSVSLLPKEIENVKSTCESTKTSLKALQITNDTMIRKRLVVYGDIQRELAAIETRLFRQGADASELDLMIGSLQQDIDELNRLSQTHSDVTVALVAIDCKESPVLFAAGIYELRTVRQELSATSQSLRRTVLESAQTTFKPLVDRLII